MLATKRRILCIDNRASGNLAVFLLRRAGYEVVTADSVADALELSRGARFDLFLLNHKLIQAVGGKLCRRFGEDVPHTPLLFYSTVTYPFRQRRAIRCCTLGSRTDPVAVTEVADVISRTLNRKIGSADHVNDRATKAKSRGLRAGSKLIAGAGIGVVALLVRALLHRKDVAGQEIYRP